MAGCWGAISGVIGWQSSNDTGQAFNGYPGAVLSSNVLESDTTSPPFPLALNECLALAWKMESIFQVLREPDRIRVVLYMFLTLLKGSQTAEEQMLHAPFWHALTQRSKVERQLELHANRSSLGQVVSKRDTLGCGKKPRYCQPGS